MQSTLYKNELSKRDKVIAFVWWLAIFVVIYAINPNIDTVVVAIIFLLIAFIRVFTIRSKLLELNENCLVIYKQNQAPSKVRVRLFGIKKLILAKGHIYVFVYKDESSIEVRPFYGIGENDKVLEFIKQKLSDIPHIEIRDNISFFEDAHGVYHDSK